MVGIICFRYVLYQISDKSMLGYLLWKNTVWKLRLYNGMGVGKVFEVILAIFYFKEQNPAYRGIQSE
jgi:hypothetical protein